MPILFCPYCANLLILSRMDTGGNRLECRTCPYQHPIETTIFSRKTFPRKEKEDVFGGPGAWDNADKTKIQCPAPDCNGFEAAYFQVQIRSADEPMTSFLKCMTCGNRWRENWEELSDKVRKEADEKNKEAGEKAEESDQTLDDSDTMPEEADEKPKDFDTKFEDSDKKPEDFDIKPKEVSKDLKGSDAKPKSFNMELNSPTKERKGTEKPKDSEKCKSFGALNVTVRKRG